MAPRSTGSTRTTRSSGRAATAKGSARKVAQEAEDFVEVKGGDFPDTWDFEEDGDLVGSFLGTETKNIKDKDRTIHSFDLGDKVVNVWGTAILDSRLSDVDEGARVKVQKTGKKIPTKGGRQAWEFKVYVARGALAR